MNPGQPVLRAIVIAICCGVLYLAAAEMYALRANWMPLLLGMVVGGVFYRFATSATCQPVIRWQHGALAAGIVAAVLLAQFLSQSSLMPSPAESTFQPTAEDAIVSIATDLALAQQNSGTEVNWPPGVVMEHATTKNDFPAEIWAQAQLIWERMSPSDKEQFQMQRESLVNGYHRLEQKSSVQEICLRLGMAILAMIIAFVPASRLILLPTGD